MIHNINNQPSNFNTKCCFELNGAVCGIYNTNNQIKFKTTMLKKNSCDCRTAYIIMKETIVIAGTRADTEPRNTDERYKKLFVVY